MAGLAEATRWHADVLFVVERAPYEIAVAQAKAAVSQERARQEQAQRESEQWRHRYWKLFNDITKWRDHLARKDEPEPAGEGAEKRRAIRRFLDLPDEILNAPDPLAALIAANEYPRQ